MSSSISQLIAANPRTGAQLTKADGLELFWAGGAGSLKSAGIILGELIKALATYNASANASGDLTITPGPLSLHHTEVTAVTGAGSTTRRIALSLANAPTPNARIAHRLTLPATAAITIEWHNGTVGGAVLTSMVTDASGDDAVAEFYSDGTAWNFLRFTYPANA